MAPVTSGDKRQSQVLSMLSRNLAAIFITRPCGSPDLHFRTVHFEAVLPVKHQVQTGMRLALHYFPVLPVSHFPLPHSNHLQYNSMNTRIVLATNRHTNAGPSGRAV